MNRLNPKQEQAVQFLGRPLLVIAGAGSGKTRVITEKIATLCERGFDARRLFAVTFTNKAAREMKGRLERRLSREVVRRLWISTFHTLGLEILRREHRALGFRRNFSVVDEADRLELLRAIAEERGYDKKKLSHYVEQISFWKNRALEPPPEEEIFPLFQDYQKTLRAYQAVDFDDLILLPLKLLEEHPKIRQGWQQRIAHLLVDEWQDTNLTQYLLFKRLVSPEGRFTVVGDDDQSIYGWRGADPENLKRLSEDFPALEIITLDQNYRSTRVILNAANALIENNPHLFPKKLWSTHGEGEKIRLLSYETEEEEASAIGYDIWYRRRQHDLQWRDFAILYRGNHQARLFEKTLRELNIPYTVYGGLSFFTYREVKDLIAYLRLLVNQDDDLAFLRAISVPRREIGSVTLEKLASYAKRRGISLFSACFEFGLETILPDQAVRRLRHFCEWIVCVADRAKRGDARAVIEDMVEEIDYKTWLERESSSKRLERVEDLLDWIGRLIEEALEPPASEDPLAYAVQKLQLLDILDQKSEERRPDGVSLMTIHAAKGLEFEAVYVAGLVDGILPHWESPLEEERRLLYVAITRAKRHLTLSYSKKGRKGEKLQPSRFLSELPEALLAGDGATDTREREERVNIMISALRELLEEN